MNEEVRNNQNEQTISSRPVTQPGNNISSANNNRPVNYGSNMSYANMNKPKLEEYFDEVDVHIHSKINRSDSFYDGKVIPYWAYKGLSTTLTATGVGNAWGITIKEGYKYNHTTYTGKRIKFEGKGVDLYPEIFKWILFSILTLGIYALWIPIKKHKWIISKLHFEDEEYVEGYSYFDGGLFGLIGVNIFTAFLTTISAGLLLPYAHCYKRRWYAKHTVISRKRIIFDGKALGLFGNYIKWWFLTIITFGIYGFWLPLKIYSWEVEHTRIKLRSEPEYQTGRAPMILGGIILVVILITVIVNLFGNIGNGSFNLNHLNPFMWISSKNENSLSKVGSEKARIMEAAKMWVTNNNIQDNYKSIPVRTLIDEGYLTEATNYENGCVIAHHSEADNFYYYEVNDYCN